MRNEENIARAEIDIFRRGFHNSWKSNIRRNTNSEVSIVTMRSVWKNFHAKILMVRHFMITSLFKNSA